MKTKYVAVLLLASSSFWVVDAMAWNCTQRCPSAVLSGKFECKLYQKSPMCVEERRRAAEPAPPPQPASNPDAPPISQAGKLSLQTGGASGSSGAANGGSESVDQPNLSPPSSTVRSGVLAISTGAAVRVIPSNSVTPTSLSANKGSYVIQSAGTSKCLDVPSSSRNNAITIQQYSCHGQSNQQWRFELKSGTSERGRYLIKSVSSGKCLDVPNSSSDNAVRIQQYECHGQSNQLWDVSKSGNEYIINSASSGKTLDIPWGDKKDGIQLQQYDFHGKSNQKWVLGIFVK